MDSVGGQIRLEHEVPMSGQWTIPTCDKCGKAIDEGEIRYPFETVSHRGVRVRRYNADWREYCNSCLKKVR